MPKNFFDEQQRSKEEDLIRQFLDDTSRLLLMPPLNRRELSRSQAQLEHYLKHSQSERLQRAIRKILNKIITQLNTEPNSVMDVDADLPICLIQIPGPEDLAQMTSMPAGEREDQHARLSHMAELITAHSEFAVITTEKPKLKPYWQQLFKMINLGKKEFALSKINEIATRDPLLQLILVVHPIEYLEDIISNCILAQRTGLKRMNTDIVIKPKTFELLIKDLATTLQHKAPLYFSFGLPTHHAFHNEGTGFCIINKTAILIKHAELTHTKALKYVIIGTDVNRDNGLCKVLCDSASHLDLTHIDVFDSRVYPRQKFNDIKKEFATQGLHLSPGIRTWTREQLHYTAFDLSLERRIESNIHPAIHFAVEQLKIQIEQAKISEQQLMLFLPTGWDSHEHETAFCGAFVNGHMMSTIEAKKHRFNNSDLVYFYEQVLQLYQRNKETFSGMYWGLEGGYNRAMYEEQIELLLTTVARLHPTPDLSAIRLRS
jgi:acetoin utilization deacetylase AcuC-like enzyme